MAAIIDGKKIAQEIKDELKEKAACLKEKGKTGALAVIQVGDDPASSVYVRNKKNACAYIGIESLSYELSGDTTQQELLALIQQLNEDERVRGILVQLPVPGHIDENAIIKAIRPEKEPMALLLLRENGTVTVAHSRTRNLKELCRQADILVVAIGKPRFIDAEYIKEGAVVIDVGIHRDAHNKLCGDVKFEEVEPLASAITPVPGGVGPMTIAMLMNNCVESIAEIEG